MYIYAYIMWIYMYTYVYIYYYSTKLLYYYIMFILNLLQKLLVKYLGLDVTLINWMPKVFQNY